MVHTPYVNESNILLHAIALRPMNRVLERWAVTLQTVG